MSLTAVLTMAASKLAKPTASLPGSCCPTCGLVAPTNDLSNTTTQDAAVADLVRAQSRIAELEAQVTQLNEKATAAVSRWAEYEAELHRLRSTQRSSTPLQAEPVPVPVSSARQSQSPTSSFFHQGTSRLSSLLYPRKSTPNLRADMPRQNSLPYTLPIPGSPVSLGAASTEDLIEALTKEQILRKEAEGRLSATSKEVEELSVSLFEQANEMVADERRARTKLEERVGELEKRDKEKRRRLERLEGAVGRIEKVRNLLEKS